MPAYKPEDFRRDRDSLRCRAPNFCLFRKKPYGLDTAIPTESLTTAAERRLVLIVGALVLSGWFVSRIRIGLCTLSNYLLHAKGDSLIVGVRMLADNDAIIMQPEPDLTCSDW